MMFYLDRYPSDPPGYHVLSISTDWEPWIRAAVPRDTIAHVRARLISNLKHILVGLEMKAGLIVPHGERVSGKSVLFEPYCQVLTFEFCIGVFSICEGLGSIRYLNSQDDDGSSRIQVRPNNWISALCGEYDSDRSSDLEKNVRTTKFVRDKMHQDRLGARENIDWHEFGYINAFIPARNALKCLLHKHEEQIPETTNLS